TVEDKGSRRTFLLSAGRSAGSMLETPPPGTEAFKTWTARHLALLFPGKNKADIPLKQLELKTLGTYKEETDFLTRFIKSIDLSNLLEDLGAIEDRKSVVKGKTVDS